MKKLHLGCGKTHLPGYLNVDIQPGDNVDLVCDVRELELEKSSFEVIYACAVIEHFGRREWKNILAHWVSFLAPGGIIRISTSDFEACIKRYNEEKNLEELMGLLIGGQKDDWDWHGIIFDFSMMEAAFQDLGLTDIKRYDWRDTDSGLLGVDDYSQAYLPHMDKENGQLMVLNIEARKPIGSE